MAGEGSARGDSGSLSARERYGEAIWQTTLAGRRGPEAVPGARAAVLPFRDLARLVEVLNADYDVIGWVPGSGSVALTQVQSADDLALGYRDHQQPGLYQLERPEPSAPRSYASFSHGSDSPKKFLHPSRLTIFEGSIAQGPAAPKPPARPLAFLGMRSCDLAATLINDRTFLGQPADSYYAERRLPSFVVASCCTRAGGTCFCASMGTGPRPRSGYDVRMTEIGSELLLEPGSEAGVNLLRRLGGRAANVDDLAEAERLVGQAAAGQGLQMRTEGLVEGLRGALDHPYWEHMANWCIGCTNCTIVCPTCFCYDIVDRLSASLDSVVRERYWDSCFTQRFTALPELNPRAALRPRYRHWLCHKLSFWTEQFGVFGCIGCGRCITWCPVRIDITYVADQVRQPPEVTTAPSRSVEDARGGSR